MHSTGSLIRFVLILTATVALLLSFLSTGLKGIHDKNEAIYNKRAILSAVQNELGKDLKKMTDDEVQSVFDNQITQTVINMKGEELTKEEVEARGYKGGMAENVDTGKERKKSEQDRILPFYTFKKENGDQLFIVSVRGNGLWDEIWGNIALRDDLKTIAGVSFDHKAETPGLGAEIKDNPAFPKSFIDKMIYNEAGEFTSVGVIKGGARNPKHEVDGISGATITADGVDEMLRRNLRYYEAYFQKIKRS